MNFNELNSINDAHFLRLTGVERNVFNKMLDILKKVELEKFKRGGKPNKLPLESRLLMAISYWREYRTYFHTGKSFGISESTCYRNTTWIEDTLIKHPDFQQLFGKKELIRKHFADKTIIIDATESPIQRPKKNKSERNIFQGKIKNIQ